MFAMLKSWLMRDVALRYDSLVFCLYQFNSLELNVNVYILYFWFWEESIFLYSLFEIIFVEKKPLEIN